jgi:IS30 family transposase
MSDRGQPRALDDEKQKTVCSLVAAGASLRQAAHFVDCDPKTIRREARRNHDFRCRLAKAKSEANIHPLQTLQQAAKTNWRAALSWMERLDPVRFARPDAKLITQREANQFVAHLVESIERAVSRPKERNALFNLLTPAMPTPMRRRWNDGAMRRAVARSTQIFENRKEERETRKCLEKAQRDLRRRNLWHEISQWLPTELYQKLAQNEDLFDPEEVFAQPPGPGPLVRDPQRTYKPGSIGAQKTPIGDP